MKKIAVMIIEDSTTVREMLRQIIEEDSRLRVVACVESAEEGLKLLPRIAPDVISLDIRLPGMNGLEATLRIMAERPTPIVVISDDIECNELKISMNALRAGALSVVEKPVGPGHPEHAMFARKIREQLVAMSSVKVVRQRFARNLPFNAPGEPSLGFGETIQRNWDFKKFAMLGVVASTGGPAALTRLFQSLPSDFPLPIALVQHIAASFVTSFASWLGSNCSFKVRIAADGEAAKPGTIYLAPPNHHILAESGYLRTSFSEPICLERPSGSALFRSMARNLGDSSFGVILTGMGADGAEGLLEIRKAGGYTIAEDSSTAVVYGMPEVAVRIGAICESLPIDAMGERIVELVSARKEEA